MNKYKKNKRCYYLRKHKIIGAILVGLAAVSIIITGGDITAAVLFGTLGLYLMFAEDMPTAEECYHEAESE